MALLRPATTGRSFATALVPALTAAGHRVVQIDPRSGILDRALGVRKIGDGLGRVPPALIALRTARCPVAHAFAPADALAAALWAAHGGGAVVFTVAVAPEREQLAARRLRLATLVRALEGSAAVVATDREVAYGLERWLGVRAPVIAPEPADGAAAAYIELYRQLG